MQRETAEKTAESQRKPRHDSTIQWRGATGGPQHPILRMQQLAGNRAVGRALQAQKFPLSELGASPPRFGVDGTLRRKCASCDENDKAKLQAKLLIGSSLDPEELEAERIADLAMQAPVAAEGLHTGCTRCAQHSGQPPFGRVTPLVQRRTSGPDGLRAAPSSVDQALQQPGQPLEPRLLDDMAARLGFDFSKVRIHSGAMADASAREVNARAYTVGHHIVFGAAQFAPSTRQGRHLLAHELTHVVQQTAGQGASIVSRQAGPTQASCERGHQPGALVKTSGKVEPETIIYHIWGTWQSGDTLESWDRRTFSDWIRWRFAGITAQQSNRVLASMLQGVIPEPDPPIAVPGCQYSTSVSAHGLAQIRQLSGEVGREQQAAKQKAEAKIPKPRQRMARSAQSPKVAMAPTSSQPTKKTPTRGAPGPRPKASPETRTRPRASSLASVSNSTGRAPISNSDRRGCKPIRPC